MLPALKTAGLQRRMAVAIAIVLMARVLLPCFPLQALVDPDADFYVICTPSGIVDLRALSASDETGLPADAQQDRQQPTPGDRGVFYACSGFCGLTLSLLAADDAFPPQVLAERRLRTVIPTGAELPPVPLGYSLAARAPPSFPG